MREWISKSKSTHSRAVTAVLLLAGALLAASAVPGDGSLGLTPKPDLNWRELYQGGRQAFNLGNLQVSEAWLREAARKNRPWPKKVVTVDNFPETFLPYYHLSWVLSEQGQCEKAEGVLETSVRQGVVLAHRKKHRRLRTILFRRCGSCGSECIEGLKDIEQQAMARWEATEASLGERQRRDLEALYPELSTWVRRARQLMQDGHSTGDPIAFRLAADLAVGAVSRLEVVSCMTRNPEWLGRCEIRELAKGVVKIEASVDRRRGTGFVVSLGRATADILTLTHVVENSQSVTLRFPSRPDWPVRARIHRIEEKDPNGLAVIRVDGEIPSVRCLIISDSLPTETETVFTIGFPIAAGLHWTMTQGSVAGPPENGRLKTNLTVDEGNSGGPLIREDGRIIGIVSERASDVSEFAFARDVRSLKATLDQWQLQPHRCNHDVYSLPPNR